MSTTLYWHDYETTGVDPRRDRPVQFAGLRTDEALNEIGDPLMIYCQPARDVLPVPDACLVTRITPQQAQEKGVNEAGFIAAVHAEMARPGTCGVGYNSLRFDDEVTRHTLYRNFDDPDAREWQNGNSRWDLIDVARMTYAMRPAGIEWPTHADGRPDFRLEKLTSANGIGHESAHDALSDVRATIGLARLLRERQPRIYDWLYRLRDKRQAIQQLDLATHKPVVHTSGMYPPEHGCTTLVMPLAQEQGNKNGMLVYDLRVDPGNFAGLDVEALRERLFTRKEDLPEGTLRLPVKAVRVNKCPALAPLKTLDEEAAQRIALDVEACQRHRQALLADTGLMRRVTQAFAGREFAAPADVDQALYNGFISNADRAVANRVLEATPEALAQQHFNFRDKRLPELLFRYRARNWPEMLSPDEHEQWDEFRRQRLLEPGDEVTMKLDRYTQRIAELRTERADDASALQLLDSLESWGRELV